jgi:hypothetical protein
MSELFPANPIAIEVLCCTDPAREGEFNRWYDKVHIPILPEALSITTKLNFSRTPITFRFYPPCVERIGVTVTTTHRPTALPLPLYGVINRKVYIILLMGTFIYLNYAILLH